MSITKENVKKLSRLTRIEIPEADEEKMAAEITSILKWIEQLSEVDTKGVEPLTSVVDMQLYLREDEITDGGYPEKIVQNAAESTAGFFVVPKVVE